MQSDLILNIIKLRLKRTKDLSRIPQSIRVTGGKGEKFT